MSKARLTLILKWEEPKTVLAIFSLRVAQAFLSLAVIAPVTAVSAFPLRTGVAQVGIPAYPVE